MDFLFFGGFPAIGRILVVGTLSYLALLVVIRLAGQRPLGRMQTFDLVVAVAIGSTYGRLLTAQEVQFAEAATAFALLMALHYMVSWLSYRSPMVAGWLETKPMLVYFRGRQLPGAMRRNRMTEDELLTVVRLHGYASLQDVSAVVLEPDGFFSVLGHHPTSDWSALANVAGAESP
jgi:uncharacterized membrane protein YcaP (DUF421 family)